MNNDIATLQSAIAVLGNISAWQIVGVITATGTIAMAILQLVKDLTPLRRIYQKLWLFRWIEARAGDFNQNLTKSSASKTLKKVSPRAAEECMVDLATGGAARAFYELTAEQIVAQINAAAQIVLDYPKKYSDLLFVLAEGADIDDVETVIAESREGSRSRKPATPAPDYLEARSRVGHRIQRNLDAIQIALGSRWKFWMQIIAIALSTLLLESAVISIEGVHTGAILMALPIGIAGGYFAPVSRDLVAALQTLRK
jgi:hypothetical protein